MRITKRNILKRKRQIGFRAKMSTKSGRKVINRRRAVGRKLLAAK